MEKPVKKESGKRLTQIMAAGYIEDHQRAAEGAFVIWIAIMVPVEIIQGFPNVVFCVPESHAAMTAAKGAGAIQCEKSESLGYSMDLCSYARIDMGSFYDNGKDSSIGGLAKPELVISNTNNCSLLTKWFDVYARELAIPHLVLDVPFCYTPQTRTARDYIIDQFKEMIQTIERLSGQTFSMDKTAQALEYTDQAHGHWKEYIAHARLKPSPITAFDTFANMAPFLTLRGTKTLRDYYRLLVRETKERANQDNSPVKKETYRLFWDNIAPWHQLRSMSGRLKALDANIVGATYTSCIGSLEGSFAHFPYDGGPPLDHLARTQNGTVCPNGLHLRSQAMKEAISDLSVDGVIFASNRSCKVYSITQMDQMSIITGETGTPAVMIDVDHADVRHYNEEATFTRIEALLEQIEFRRANIP